jgi:hypothetical protein
VMRLAKTGSSGLLNFFFPIHHISHLFHIWIALFVILVYDFE